MNAVEWLKYLTIWKINGIIEISLRLLTKLQCLLYLSGHGLSEYFLPKAVGK